MQQRLGEAHPLSLSCAVNLANCLADSGELAPALNLQHETISRLAAVLGTDHPDTLVCESNLAVTLHNAGREAEAAERRTHALDGLGQVLGSDHPDAIQLRNWQWINRDLEPQLI